MQDIMTIIDRAVRERGWSARQASMASIGSTQMINKDIDDVVGGPPVVAEALDETLGVGCGVAGEDDHVGLGDVRRDRTAVLEVQIGEDLDIQRALLLPAVRSTGSVWTLGRGADPGSPRA